MLRQFTEANNAEAADVKLGETFEISLSENPTTGFRWNLAGRLEPVCTLAGDDFKPASAPGGEGIHSWRFVAAAAGETSIRFTLGRSWTPNVQPAKSFSLTVRVAS